MVPSWSNRAKKAISVFFRQWNDVDVYVEDQNPCTLRVFESILERLTTGSYRVSRIFPIGAKHKAIEASKEYTKRPSIFIVDSDLDLLLDLHETSSDNLYFLNRYCIENFLIDESATIEIIFEEDSTAPRHNIATLLDFNDWISTDVHQFSELFVIYAVLRKYLPSLKTVSNSLGCFTSGGKHPYIDSHKVSTFIGKRHAWLCELYGYDTIIKEELDIYDRVSTDPVKYISGKDYLLPSLYRHIRKVAKVNARNESIKIRLAKYCDISSFSLLKEKMDLIALGRA